VRHLPRGISPGRPGAAGLWGLVVLAAGSLAAGLVLFPARQLPVRAELQTAADAAALAAAAELAAGADAATARDTGLWYAAANGEAADVRVGPDRVRVTAARAAARAGATAVVDRSFGGLRPTPGVAAPLVPLAVPAAEWERAEDEGTDATVRLAALVPLRLGGDFGRQFAAGTTAADLEAFGGQFVPPLTAPVATDVSRWDVRAAVGALTGPRVWPLAGRPTGDSVRVPRLVAARVVAVGPAAVTLRPCVVVTAAAVAGGAAGPYLVRVRLTD